HRRPDDERRGRLLVPEHGRPIFPGSAILFRVRPNGRDPDSAIKDTWVLEWRKPDDTHEQRQRPLERKYYPDWTQRDWGEITTQD
ncbi:MAG TPA: hypothetical protein VF942_13475, partial [Acidimicrobiales bacterium]